MTLSYKIDQSNQFLIKKANQNLIQFHAWITLPFIGKMAFISKRIHIQ